MQPQPRSLALFWPGHLHGTGCLSAQAIDIGFSYCCVAFVFGYGFFVNPADPGWGLGCLCLGTEFRFAAPILDAVCGVCVWAWVLPSGLGSRLCLSGFGSWLHPTNSRWGVGVCVIVCALRQYLAIPCRGLWCVCFGARVLALPRQLWLRYVVWVCECGFGFWLQPANPGCGVGVCMFVCALCLYPAISGWDFRCWCVRLLLGSGCAGQFLAGVFGCVCLCEHSACTLSVLAAVHGAACWFCFFCLRPANPG